MEENKEIYKKKWKVIGNFQGAAREVRGAVSDTVGGGRLPLYSEVAVFLANRHGNTITASL